MPRREIISLLAAETPALLRAMEDGLLALERGEDVSEAAHSALRAVHSVASGAAVAGCEPMERLAGGMELGLRLVALGRLEPRQHLTDALLQAADVLAAMFARLEEMEHVETGGALRALDAALGAGLSSEEAEALKPRPFPDPLVSEAVWRLSPWLLEHKFNLEGVFRLTLAGEAQASGEALYTRLGELLTLGEVLACAPLSSGELSILYASPLERDLLSEALSLPRERLRLLGPAEMGLAGQEEVEDIPVPEEDPIPEPAPPAPRAATTPPPSPPTGQAGPAAPEPPAKTGGETWGQHLVFRLGSEVYAVPVSLVREIVTLPPVTALPLSPDHVLGVMNLRGSVVPVFDLRRRLGLPTDRQTDPVVVMLRLEGKLQGVVVDAVDEVIALPEDQVQEPPDMAGAARREYLRGLVEQQGEMIILMDLERLLSAVPVGHAA